MSANRGALSLKFKKLLKRSRYFLEALLNAFEGQPLPDVHRVHAAYASCGIAFDHAHAIRLLLESQNYTSALSLVRLQFESLVRANWLAHAAPEGWVEKFFNSKIPQQLQDPGSPFPRIDEMLETTLSAINHEYMSALCQLKKLAWPAMNSYTHGGQRQISRYLDKYDPLMIEEAIKNSNGLAWITAKTLIGILQAENVAQQLKDIHSEHHDCLHHKSSA